MNKLLSFIRRKILRIPADRWDYQYGRGEWDQLAGEAKRFDAVIDLIREHYQAPAILEIGCGKALMLLRMNPSDFSYFTGVDLSEVAVNDARQYETERVQFVAADMQSFTPERKYDVVAFNESLYYAKDPAATFARYLPYLNEDGCIIVTAFENKYTEKLWPALGKNWLPLHSRKVIEGPNVWNVRMYRPSATPKTKQP
jgi:2-polyprenyl-6-hydroxyphenyl methylase/3-demethylubiquinone-9 3-methyltransferase